VTPPSPLRAGETVNISCEGEGGQPRPTLALTLGGESLTFHQGEEISEVITYAFEAKPAHQGALLTCSAINRVMEAPVAATLQLEVLCKLIASNKKS